MVNFVLYCQCYNLTGVLISSSVPPIVLAVVWARTTAAGMLSGAVLGAAAGIASWLGFASTFPGGLGAETFLRNTGKQLAMMAGNCVSLGVGAVVCVAVTFATRPRRMTPAEVEDEWRKTFTIDNPLRPWSRRYKDVPVVTDQPAYNLSLIHI